MFLISLYNIHSIVIDQSHSQLRTIFSLRKGTRTSGLRGLPVVFDGGARNDVKVLAGNVQVAAALMQ